MLYQILIDMKSNVDTLKAEVKSLRTQINEQRSLAGAQGFNTPTDESVYNLPKQAEHSGKKDKPEFLDAVEVQETQSLNLKELSHQALLKVLEKNGGNRKKAADELGISDRTLYRRLKEFDIK